jgi:hypothetical protein
MVVVVVDMRVRRGWDREVLLLRRRRREWGMGMVGGLLRMWFRRRRRRGWGGMGSILRCRLRRGCNLESIFNEGVRGVCVAVCEVR